MSEVSKTEGVLTKLLSSWSSRFYISLLLLILLMGIAGPFIAPYEADERVRGENGELLKNEPPSTNNLLGTTDQGYDVLSRLLIGTRPTILSGLMGGGMIITIGLTIGLVSGYMGGIVDTVLMRLTDVAYGIPLIPFALVLVALFGVGYFTSILIIGALLWRSSARVIRSQTLQIKERSFILATKATGASTPRIILRHILPNVAPMAILFFALTTGATILIMASLSFLGVTDPFVPSWGIMVRNAFDSGLIAQTPWWVLPPGLAIAFTVLSLFMVGRTVETILDEEQGSDAEMVQVGG